ncbi:MAG: hypothetical protein HQK62_14235, partial [Desulfamplus sp.]|nr:hypothetical protein [Desulfamplus sp.]
GAYWLIGHPWETGYLQGVSNWAISNIVGAIVITPILVSLRLEWIVLRPLKFDIFITFGLLLLTFMIFGYGESIIPPIFHQPSFLLIPLVFVAVKRSQGFTFFLLALTFFLVWTGTTMGYCPFFELHESVANASMQVFIGVSAIVILLMQAVTTC